MNYIVIEIQTNAGTSAIVPPVLFTDRNAAEAQFHTMLAAAAISSVEIHSVIMLTEDGRIVRTECYRHSAATNEE